jgi:hypothetical protein
MSELIVSHRLTIPGVGVYQNAQLGAGDFLPFGFSGAVANRTGDNITASLVLPSNALSQSWVATLINQRAVVTVEEVCNGSTVYSYTGQVSSGSVEDTSVRIELSSVLDAVSSEVPWRFLTEDLVGPLPMSGNVRIS